MNILGTSFSRTVLFIALVIVLSMGIYNLLSSRDSRVILICGFDAKEKSLYLEASPSEKREIILECLDIKE